MWTNFWHLRVNERLTRWKEFRGRLSSLPLPQAVDELNQMWSTAPFVGYYLDPNETTNWPDPWSLIAENYWCDVAKCLGILYTLYFTSHHDVPMEIRVYYDYKDKARYCIAWIDEGKYILNYWPFEIVNTEQLEEKQLKLLYQYSSKDLALEKY